MSDAIRFQPPAFDPPPGTGWVLRRAFGPAHAGPADPGAPAETVVQLARRLGLAARIGAVNRREDLEREIGPAAAVLRRDSAVCAAQETRLAGVTEMVAQAAAAAGTQVAILKGAALARGGYVAPGSRWASDVDALAPRERIDALQRELERRGWRGGGPAYEHQLPSLIHARGGAVELHRVVLGVRLAGGWRSAGFSDLAARGLLRADESFGGTILLPAPDVLAAHAVAHGLGQHGFEPGSYSPFRMVGDLLDLGAAGDPSPLIRVTRWLSRAVPAAEIAGLAALCRWLAAGEDGWGGASRPSDPAAVLLGHFLAGVFDEEYQRALKLRRLRFPFSDAPWPLAVVRGAGRALFPSAPEVAAIYGHPGSRWRAWASRCARPFDVARRLFAAARAARMVRRRRLAP